jgi:hypothetical protein
VVPLLDTLAIALGGVDREPHLDDPALELAADLEARVGEDAQHGPVRGHDLGDERVDADVRRPGCQLLEQARRDPAPLVLVGNRERDLRATGIAQPREARERDDPFGERPHEKALLDPVGLEERHDETPVDRPRTVETEVEALLRKAGEEVDHRVGVVLNRWPQPQRAAVPQDHVDGVGRRPDGVQVLDHVANGVGSSWSKSSWSTAVPSRLAMRTGGPPIRPS